ncbi:transposase, partial [Streptomyces mirabilis]|uniref:transposase n=1 Tax=Streptomyces mirabilis TaxID=68239 RepID=UPI0036292A2E
MDQLVVGPGVPLADAQWARIEPLLPDRTPKRGGRRRDHREVIDAIAFKFQTGTQWLHVPDKEVGQPARCLQPAADGGRRWHWPTRHPMQLSGQAAAASGADAGVLKAIASSNFW